MKRNKKIKVVWFNENVPNNSLEIEKDFETEMPISLNEVMDGSFKAQDETNNKVDEEFDKYLSDLIKKFLFNHNQSYTDGTWSLSRGGESYLDLTLKDDCEQLTIHIRDEVEGSDEIYGKPEILKEDSN